jgi:hypothetical protein
MSQFPFALVLVLVPAGLGCSSNRAASAPVMTTGAEVSEGARATRAFPPDRPGGDVRLATMGLARLSEDEQFALHVHMVVSNRSSEPWTIPEAEQRLQLQTHEESFAVSLSGEPVGVVEVSPGTKVALDLFFRLPPRLQRALTMEPFSIVWTIYAGGLSYTLRSDFEGFPVAAVEETSPTSGGPASTPVSGGGTPSAGVP